MDCMCYCPYCGHVTTNYKLNENKICVLCQIAYNKKRVMLNTKENIDYWFGLEIYNDKDRKISDVTEKVRYSYVYNNPLFKQETRDYVLNYNKKENEWLSSVQAKTNKTIAQQASQPKCPTCGSTNIKKLDTFDRAVSVGLFGIFSKKINKSFECRNCKYTW